MAIPKAREFKVHGAPWGKETAAWTKSAQAAAESMDGDTNAAL